MEKATFIPKVKSWKVNEKGRPPANRKEELAAQIAKITKSPVGRWMKYPEVTLDRAGIDLRERPTDTVKNKAAYLTWLIKKYAPEGPHGASHIVLPTGKKVTK